MTLSAVLRPARGAVPGVVLALDALEPDAFTKVNESRCFFAASSSLLFVIAFCTLSN